MKIAKYWLSLQNNEKDQFWQKIDTEKAHIIESVKQHETYKQAMSCEEPIKEVSDESDQDNIKNFKRTHLGSAYDQDVEMHGTSSDDDDESKDKWNQYNKNLSKMAVSKIGNKNIFAKKGSR